MNKTNKKKKKINTLQEKINCINNLLLETNKLINNKIIYNIIVKISDEYSIEMSIDEIEQYLIKIIEVLNNNKIYFQQLKLYSKIIVCCFESLIYVCRSFKTFLSKKIDINLTINNIFNEITLCFNKDIYFYNLIINLEIEQDNEDNQVICKDIRHIINVITDILKIINNLPNEKTIDILKNIKNTINKIYVKKKFNKIISGLNNWNVINNKIYEYISTIQPFDIYNINQKYDQLIIINKIQELLEEDKTNNLNNLNLCNITLSKLPNNKLKEIYIIIKRMFYIKQNLININIEIKRVEIDIINIKNTEDIKEKINILKLLNNFINFNHKKLNEENTNLNISSLQNNDLCNEHIYSFSKKINWIEICQSIKNYLYFLNLNINKINNIEKYKTIKCSLKSIIKNKSLIKKLDIEVKKVNEIITRTYLFIKLYILDLHNKKLPIADITDFNFISMSMRTICINDTRGSNMSDDNKILLKNLEIFYKKEFLKIYPIKCNAIGLSQILNFTKIQMVTAYTNNIVMNYPKYLKSYLISTFREIKKEEFELIKDKKVKKEFTKEIINKVDVCINDILCGYLSGTYEKMKSKNEYKNWIINNINKFLPSHIDFTKIGLENDLEKNPTTI